MRSLLIALALATSPVLAHHGGAPVKLEVLPPDVSLTSVRDSQHIVVLATFADGITRDVTADAEISVTGGAARLAPGFVLQPAADGSATVQARLGKLEAATKITVKGAKKRLPVSFSNDVIPTLTRRGCNAGTCHGAASGKNGFRLSLYGFDKAHDHIALTRELRGRRANPADPEGSLMLLKPTSKVGHKGGKKLVPGSNSYETLRQWIAAGATNDVASAPKLTGIEVMPEEAVLDGPGQTVGLIVRARYSDGTDRDVTDLARLNTSNDVSAKVDDHGTVKSNAPGEAFILARFGTFAVVSQILVLDPDAHLSWPKDAVPVNYIDEAVYAKLRKLRIAPAGLCRDSAYLRRVYLDVLGILPDPDETRSFLADKDPDKRRRLVDELLERPEFPDVWAMQWAEWLRIEPRKLERKGMYVYTEYLRKAFRDQKPFDQLVREILTSKGGNFENPATNFFLTERDPKLIAENVSQVFLGIRIQCAQCHNHPFERWKMDDYYGFAAFFARLAQKRGEDPRERIVFPRGSGEVRNIRTGRNAVPKFLGGAEPKIPRYADRRVALAEWLTSPENPWFAKNVANRVFARFFGRGIVDPTDDVRVSNPPSHPALHKELGEKLIEYGYDIRKLIRDICASRTYQQAKHEGSVPASSFAGAQARRLTAEELLDSLSEVLGVPTKYAGLPLGARATEIRGGVTGNRFLSLFGRPARTSSCTCERRGEPTLSQVLHLINGPTIESKLRNNNGRLAKLIAAKASDESILEQLWLAAYCRFPTADESKRILAQVRGQKNRRQAWEDVFWAALNSKEFLFLE